MDDGNGSENIIVPLVAMSLAALIFFIYHLIAIFLWNQNHQHQQQSLQAAAALSQNHVISYPLAHLIPIHKYHKKGKVDGDEGGDSTCAVCLGEFEEGQELRTLPECMHSFHVPCIDMWLYSHTSCPICRAIAIAIVTPFPAMFQLAPLPDMGYGHNHMNPHHSINIMQFDSVRS
ncbi:hypothetical protein TanjilG_20606 [Lupinus angustifolius]|uniref:RING-type domain-containing protein n=1 Tax=Lupinus angustifolius TaxID=3871 RepID=A0A4P1QRA0_LUPAN|nr:hypothetical protein TanjilG_20606 [Lupinus angustifolius]